MSIVYLLWSNKHSAWWRPGDFGYTSNIDEAGSYSEADAVARVVRSSHCGDRTQVTLMVAAPANWEPPARGCPAHGVHPHGGRVCLDCPTCFPERHPAGAS